MAAVHSNSLPIPHMAWYSQDIRPLSDSDVGRFVVGHGLPGWISGFVEQLHGDYLVIDTGRTGGPLNGNVVAEALQVYAFIDDLPGWVRPEHA